MQRERFRRAAFNWFGRAREGSLYTRLSSEFVSYFFAIFEMFFFLTIVTQQTLRGSLSWKRQESDGREKKEIRAESRYLNEGKGESTANACLDWRILRFMNDLSGSREVAFNRKKDSQSQERSF